MVSLLIEELLVTELLRLVVLLCGTSAQTHSLHSSALFSPSFSRALSISLSQVADPSGARQPTSSIMETTHLVCVIYLIGDVFRIGFA